MSLPDEVLVEAVSIPSADFNSASNCDDLTDETDMSFEFSNFDVNETETDMVHSNNRINNVEPVTPVMPASIDIEKKVNEDDLLKFIFVNNLKRTTSDYNRAKAKFGDIDRPLFEKLTRSAERCAA